MADTYRPWELVQDPAYFRQVLGNFVGLGLGPKSGKSGTLRFGTTGVGHAPNYQIETPDGQQHCFNGMGHQEASRVDDAFDPANLSVETFTYPDVQNMLENLTGR